jgi:outer membrane murein-binding lipoprotein Lpp
MKRIWLVVIGVILFMLIWGNANIASSQQADSRISSLEAELNRVESRLNQLESQLSQSGSRTPATIPLQSSSGRVSQPNRSFDRLATLVIELKQQVDKLETRVRRLESR